MKDAYYFPHDSNAHNDPKILGLRLKTKWEGIGIYWTLIEILRDCPGYKHHYDLAILELGLSLPQATLEATLEACFKLGLMVKNDGFFSSPALDRRMADMDAKREIFREAGRRGGIKSSQAQATLKPGSSHPQAVKERKVKESINKVFTKPSFEELKTHLLETRSPVDPYKFFNHYESNGWKVGRNPMKSWKAAIKTWERSDFNNNGKEPLKAVDPLAGEKMAEKKNKLEELADKEFQRLHPEVKLCFLR